MNLNSQQSFNHVLYHSLTFRMYFHHDTKKSCKTNLQKTEQDDTPNGFQQSV